LLARAKELGIHVNLDSTVLGIYKNKEVSVLIEDEVQNYKADAVIIATGAAENMIPFKGWDLPGVMGAGAAQTMMNIQGIRPGQKILMVGSGNVGLVVSFQLLQAGCEVAAIIDAAPRVGGYGVHAAKVTRTGIPLYTSYTVVEAKGSDSVASAVIARVDEKFQPIPGTELELDVDTICIAVGLSPMSQLADNAGCAMEFAPGKGGNVPVLSDTGETSVANVYCAGDVAGIEEASSAMIQGKIAGAAIARDLGYIDGIEFIEKKAAYTESLSKIRAGMFAPGNKGKVFEKTDEGYTISGSLLAKGYLAESELMDFPALDASGGTHIVIECTQNIPCDPCQDVCPAGCITVGSNITMLPKLDPDKKCTGCGLCVGVCSGQAIFLVNDRYEAGYGTVGLPYEFLPLPEKGSAGKALDRSGAVVCDASVVEVRTNKAMDKTAMLVMKVPLDKLNSARFFKAAAAEGGN
jgi:thioredoxin reductase/ferredoxin